MADDSIHIIPTYYCDYSKAHYLSHDITCASEGTPIQIVFRTPEHSVWNQPIPKPKHKILHYWPKQWPQKSVWIFKLKNHSTIFSN